MDLCKHKTQTDYREINSVDYVHLINLFFVFLDNLYPSTFPILVMKDWVLSLSINISLHGFNCFFSLVIIFSFNTKAVFLSN